MTLGLLTTQALGQDKTLSGDWSATAMTSTWSIGDWGPACGPRPGGGGAPAGAVRIVQQGRELSMTGAGRSFSTTQCWEQFPGLTRRSHSATARSWRNVCKTGASDSRQATVITTLNATDTTLHFDETGQYQFVIQGQNCTASVRRNRSFRLLRRAGETAAGPAPAETTTQPTTPTLPRETSAGRCRSPGPAARLEVRPSRKLLRPGDDFQFRALVVDAAGCALGVRPVWKVEGGDAPLSLSGDGSVKVAPDAQETEVEIVVSVTGREATVIVEIASAERYDALLSQGVFNAEGESQEAAVAVISSGSIGAGSSVVEDRPEQRRLRFVALVGAGALVVGLLGLVLVLLARRKKAAAEPAALDAPNTLPLDVPRKNKICPVCGQQYSADSSFCGTDGAALVNLN